MKLKMIQGCAAVAAILLAVGVVGYANRASAGSPNPTAGYTLHIDADQHFGGAHAAQIAHHWCKAINPNLTECQLYDADGPGARLIGVETIVPASVWKTFAPAEQAQWHFHKTELAKIHATLPGMSKDQQAKVMAAIAPTYGKVWILWNPAANVNPSGQPTVVVLR